ncbi:MAG: flagellar basal body-associated protein FliL [Paracoccaceae bacterium]
MADATANAQDLEEDAPKKSGKLGLILGVVLALAGAGGGFYAVQSGLLGGTESYADDAASDTPDGDNPVAPLPDLAFVEMDPILISLRDTNQSAHLRFRAQLEVAKAHMEDVKTLKPRIVDLMNGYLRALHPSDFEDPLILTRLRAQLLRRIQIVAGEGRVNDVLIMEFVLN